MAKCGGFQTPHLVSLQVHRELSVRPQQSARDYKWTLKMAGRQLAAKQVSMISSQDGKLRYG
jgi:hypothetical protein